MSAECRALIAERLRERGSMTVAEYMDLALYDPGCGYYARASCRTGRAGDFVTSVDLGPCFGGLLGVQLAEMWRLLDRQAGQSTVVSRQSTVSPQTTVSQQSTVGPQSTVGRQSTAVGPASCRSTIDSQQSSGFLPFDLVEAGAGSGRLACDILDWAAASDPPFYEAVHLHLVERSAAARASQPAVLGRHTARLATSTDTLPTSVTGAILANELLDALPTHLVEMTADGLREVYVAADGDRLIEQLGPPSTPELAERLASLGIALVPGSRAEISLAATRWVRAAGSCLDRGFLLLIDYGFPASQLYSALRPSGTLAAFRRHTSPEARAGQPPPWLADPGSHDMTAHVDLTSIGAAAEGAGLTTLAVVDQMYFLLGLGLGLADELATSSGPAPRDLERRLALKRLCLPGGLGSTHKVMVFAKGVGSPRIRGVSFGSRLT